MTDDHGQTLKTTPLDKIHREFGAKMVPFAGYSMPVQYPAGIIAEHQHTRTQASLFDVSHMGQVRIDGDQAVQAFETLVPGDIQNLAVGKTRYTLFTNEAGGIIDDLMVSRQSDHLFVIVNASCKEKDLVHIRKHIGGRCRVEEQKQRALIALQGPQAAAVLGRLAPPARHMLFMTSEALRIADFPCFVTRSGYTGEDGYEISVENDDVEELVRLLLHEPEVKPAGLGARDSLRLEAGLCLYGNDIDETSTPIEAALTWTISKRRQKDGGFPGASIILGRIRDGAPRLRVGLLPEGKAPARAHTPIQDAGGETIGEVTSGGYGPTVGGPIAMGYVKTAFSKVGTPVNLMVRGRALPGKVAALPFVAHRYFTR
ncbi:MAG: glycine cleavage system aminomethyltransferase GcvT [Rhodospirillales bacterium]|nr:glycine cleavage system aminomethyltransferase GcvT [Rhodospirillales bacterium]